LEYCFNPVGLEIPVKLTTLKGWRTFPYFAGEDFQSYADLV
jgi:hypothetical protein